MSTPSPTSPPKRPRLSLQIRAIANGPTGRTSRSLAAAVDVKSPTSFNTLSNVYATAVDRSTPVQEKAPQTALNSRPSLRLQTQESSVVSKERRLQTPYLGPYLDTPITAQPISPAVAKQVYFPSAMTATPPMSAQPPEQEGARVFTFENQGGAAPVSSSSSSRVPQSATASSQPRRSKTLPTNNNLKLPYTHPRSLRSILRNSPLPPLSTKSPDSPRRQSLRLQEKAARRVAYNSPLTQTITTSKYTKSHVDLLAEDATPTTPSASSDGEDLLDATMAYTGNETRDGGQTPGPFEEMRRRMAGLRASTPTTSSSASASSSPTSSGGIRKKGGKKKEKKRRWVWTIGQDGEDADELLGSPVVAHAVACSDPKEAAAAVPAALLVTSSSVPVLAVPLPPAKRSRMTRNATKLQAALMAQAVVSTPPPLAPPVLQVQQQVVQVQETPVTAVLSNTWASSSSSSTMEATDVPRISSTPEPQTAILYHEQQQPDQQPIEPPTPSVESVASSTCTTHSNSTQDSVFESSGGGADVEMSDDSSLFSDHDCGDQQYTITPLPPVVFKEAPHAYTVDALGVAMGIPSSRGMPHVDLEGDLDMDMNMDVDTATPTATVMVGMK